MTAPDQPDLIDWLRANGLDPDRIPHYSRAHHNPHARTITVEYLAHPPRAGEPLATYPVTVKEKYTRDATTDIAAAIAAMRARPVPPNSPRPAPEPRPEPAPPAAYRALLNATDGIVRQVVELHRPHPDHVRPDGTVTWWECRGCDADGYDWERPEWPCSTSELIAGEAGVSLREADYTLEPAGGEPLTRAETR